MSLPPDRHTLHHARLVLHLRIFSPTPYTEAVTEVLGHDPAVSALAVMTGTSMRPAGDVVIADVAREAANDVIERLVETGVQIEGTIQINSVQTWISQPAFEAEAIAPGEGSDAVVWASVIQAAYEGANATWAFLSFMILATIMASIAIVLDSQILVIAAMVLGPEFGAIAALGVALVRKRYALLRRALASLLIGFGIAIAVTTGLVLLGRILGWITLADISGPRPGTSFIYTPDKWSILVAVLAGIAGVLAITSDRAGGLVGVFISVTTIPAGGNVAIGLAFMQVNEIWGSSIQLVINIAGMALAGWLTLAVQQFVWQRVPRFGYRPREPWRR